MQKWLAKQFKAEEYDPDSFDLAGEGLASIELYKVSGDGALLGGTRSICVLLMACIRMYWCISGVWFFLSLVRWRW